jgi:hypothetical protein
MEGEGFEVIKEDMPWLDGGNALFVRKQKPSFKPPQNLGNSSNKS